MEKSKIKFKIMLQCLRFIFWVKLKPMASFLNVVWPLGGQTYCISLTLTFLLTARYRHQRMKWAQAHRYWKKVAWSDESRFLHQLPTEATAPGCTGGWTQASSGGGVMLWVMFSWDMLGPNIPIAQSLTAVRYLNIVADQLHPFVETVFPDDH